MGLLVATSKKDKKLRVFLGTFFFLASLLLACIVVYSLFFEKNIIVQTVGDFWTYGILAFGYGAFSLFFLQKIDKHTIKILKNSTWILFLFFMWAWTEERILGYEVQTLLAIHGMILLLLLLLTLTDFSQKQWTKIILKISFVLTVLQLLQGDTLITSFYIALAFFIGSFYWYIYKDYITQDLHTSGLTNAASGAHSFNQSLLQFIDAITKRNNPFSEPNTQLHKGIIISVVLFFTVIGGILRVGHLQNESLYHDEVFHVSAAKGYQETGTTVLWDFVRQEPSEGNYDRSKIYTITIATLFDRFGFNEFSARIPGAVAGTLTIPLLYFVLRRNIGTQVALASTALFTFYDPAIYFARFVRGYSFLPLFILIALFFLFRIIDETEKFDSSKKQLMRLLVYGALAGGALFGAIRFGILSGTIIPFILLSFLLFIIVLSVQEKKIFSQRNLFYAAISIFVFSIFLLNYYGVLPILNIKHILDQGQLGFGASPKFIYSDYLFSNFYRITWLVQLCAFLGVTALITHYRFKGLLVTLILVGSLFSAMFTWVRYEDLRYIDFLQVSAVIIVATGFVTILRIISEFGKTLLHLHTLTAVLLPVLSIVGFFLLLTPSLPGVAIPPLTTTAQMDWQSDEGEKIHRRAVAPKYREAFEYIEAHAKKGDAILAASSGIGHYLYLTNPQNFDVYALHRQRADVQDIKDAKPSEEKFVDGFELLDSKQQVWVMIEYAHMVKPKLLKKIQRSCEDVSSKIPGNFIYNYYPEYVNQFHWPTVYKCNKALSQNNLCRPCSDFRRICSKNFEEYRDISRNFLGKDGVKMSAECVNYFVTVPNNHSL